jgi:hypothetical protein
VEIDKVIGECLTRWRWSSQGYIDMSETPRFAKSIRDALHAAGYAVVPLPPPPGNAS